MSSNKYNSNAAPSYKWTFRAIIQYEDMRYVVPKSMSTGEPEYNNEGKQNREHAEIPTN